ncbi:hypothetical protein GGI43DRAFT_428135 [Trichoderma evansii]
MMNLIHKLSPRAIGSGIKNRVADLATRNGSPHAKILNGLTRISKVAKETRFKKRKFCKFSATALLIISQNGINFLYQAFDQMFKPVMHRRLSMLPFDMEIDEPEPPCVPTIIVTAPDGMVTESHMLPPWRCITSTYYGWRESRKWERSQLMHPYWMSRLQIAEMERRRREEEEKKRLKLESEQAAALAQEQNPESEGEKTSTPSEEQNQPSEGEKAAITPREENRGFKSKMISTPRQNLDLKSKIVPTPSRNQSPSLKEPQPRPPTLPLEPELPSGLSIKRSHAEWKAKQLRKREHVIPFDLSPIPFKKGAQPQTPAPDRKQSEVLPIKRYYAECKAKEQLLKKEQGVSPLQRKDQNLLLNQHRTPQKREQPEDLSIKCHNSTCKAREEPRKQNEPEASPDDRTYPEFKPLSFPPFRHKQRHQPRA